MLKQSGNQHERCICAFNRATDCIFLVLVLVVCVGVTEARAACTPSRELSLQLKDHADGASYGRVGQWFADRRQFGCAAAAFRHAVLAEPSSAEDEYLLGLSLYSAGQTQASIGPLQKSLGLDPSSSRTHLALGSALDANGRRADAESQWRLVLAVEPSSEVALENLSRDLLADKRYASVVGMLQPVAKSGTISDALAIDLSVAYTKSGLLQQASELLQSVLQAHPQSDSVAEALAGVLMLQSRFQDAVAVLKPVVQRSSSAVAIQILYFHTLVLAHDPSAEALGKHLLTLQPHQWEVLYLMGLVRQREDDTSGAMRFFEQSIAANPAYADSHYRLGTIMAKLRDNADAKLQLQDAIRLGLETPEVHFELAHVLKSLGDTQYAQQQMYMYQEMLKVQQARAQAEAKAEQGDQAQNSGDVQGAVSDFTAAAELDPKEPVFAYKLAMALDKVHNQSAERAALLRAVDLDPGMALAQNQLGYLDSAAGDTDGAVQHFQRAVEADPAYTRAWLNLAATLCLQSKWKDARAAIAQVLALEPSNAPAKDLLQRIDQVQPQT